MGFYVPSSHSCSFSNYGSSLIFLLAFLLNSPQTPLSSLTSSFTFSSPVPFPLTSLPLYMFLSFLWPFPALSLSLFPFVTFHFYTFFLNSFLSFLHPDPVTLVAFFSPTFPLPFYSPFPVPALSLVAIHLNLLIFSFPISFSAWVLFPSLLLHVPVLVLFPSLHLSVLSTSNLYSPSILFSPFLLPPLSSPNPFPRGRLNHPSCPATLRWRWCVSLLNGGLDQAN